MADRRFADRTDAGRALAKRLMQYKDEDPIVLALPRGGVPVAKEVAHALAAPLDVIVVRKLGVPQQPELAMGAIGPAGLRHLNEALIRSAGVTPDELEAVTERERAELVRRDDRFRGDRPFPDLRGRTVILVDDGIATGSTAHAAIQVLHNMDPHRVILAVPVLPARSAATFREEVDDLVYVEAPEDFVAVGRWYDDFRQTTDEEVVASLQGPGRAGALHAGHTVAKPKTGRPVHEEVEVPLDEVILHGSLHVPPRAVGLVLFAHGSGSGRFSPRNRYVAERLQRRGIGTFLFDLLTADEEKRDRETREHRFDIPLLAHRLLGAARWTRQDERLRDLPLGYFGSSTGGGAALVADAAEPGLASAVVSRGGRPDLAEDDLGHVQAPTLLIVGGEDQQVIRMNEDAMHQIEAEVRLEVVPGASHLFEEPGKLEEAAGLATGWFLQWFGQAPMPSRGGSQKA